ncbi:MAG TPA: hypothetical protein VFC16_07415 [Nakamurella sp.]|nr:hypothetical protein [Nakamurella sp.]
MAFSTDLREATRSVVACVQDDVLLYSELMDAQALFLVGEAGSLRG